MVVGTDAMLEFFTVETDEDVEPVVARMTVRGETEGGEWIRHDVDERGVEVGVERCGLDGSLGVLRVVEVVIGGCVWEGEVVGGE